MQDDAVRRKHKHSRFITHSALIKPVMEEVVAKKHEAERRIVPWKLRMAQHRKKRQERAAQERLDRLERDENERQERKEHDAKKRLVREMRDAKEREKRRVRAAKECEERREREAKEREAKERKAKEREERKARRREAAERYENRRQADLERFENWLLAEDRDLTILFGKSSVDHYTIKELVAMQYNAAGENMEKLSKILVQTYGESIDDITVKPIFYKNYKSKIAKKAREAKEAREAREYEAFSEDDRAKVMQLLAEGRDLDLL